MLQIKPAVNQVEFHVGMGSGAPNATDDRAFMEANGIVFQSFSPLCGPCPKPDNTYNPLSSYEPLRIAGHRELLTGKLVSSIGKEQREVKSGAQVSLRWQVQQGIPVIPKTDNIEHLKENLDLFSWALSQSQMKQLTAASTPMAAGGGGDGTSGDCPLP